MTTVALDADFSTVSVFVSCVTVSAAPLLTSAYTGEPDELVLNMHRSSLVLTASTHATMLRLLLGNVILYFLLLARLKLLL